MSDSITNLKGVGDSVAKKLKILNVETIEDLLYYYPRRYDDYSKVSLISQAKPGMVTIEAKIKQAIGRYSRKGLHITEGVATDKSGSMRLIWFNQPYRAAAIDHAKDYYISGEFGLNRQHFSMLNASVELTSNFPVNTARIVPIYRETKGLKSTKIRQAIKSATPYFSLIKETLPEWLLGQYKLMPRVEAIKNMHFPESDVGMDEAKRRLGFEEVFSLSLAALLNKQSLLTTEAIRIPFNEELAKKFASSLPFKLTDEQRKVVWQIYLDIQKTSPMNRLVEGDVGTGKTVVATMAAVMAMKQGFQVAFMAPTELLARQHAETIYKLLKPLALQDDLGLLIGSLSNNQKKTAQKRLKSGEIRFIIGTHSLVQEKVSLAKLGLVIVDEQHRFGVKQRQALQAKAGHMPHVLSMTATPIPRSLQLTLYGELDVSLIRTKPYTDLPVKTKIINLNQRANMYASTVDKLKAGEQIFVVCPLISQNDDLPFRSAEEVYDELSKGVFKDYRVGLLHAKLKTDEKESIMEDFVAHNLDILVATTIIEVGVHVQNATVMVIESAERFGLAQIHQLRGRVGRSSAQGHCYLLLDDNNQPSNRLRALESNTDGFKLAELDLMIRGPGAIYGTYQHGQLDLRVAKLDDFKLIQEARRAAKSFIDKNDNLLQYEELYERVTRLRSVTNLN